MPNHRRSHIERSANTCRTCNWIYPHYWWVFRLSSLCDCAEWQYRLVALPRILSSPCHYCDTHMKVPDGLPLANTGYIPAEETGKVDTTTANGGTRLDGTDRGQWVVWHLSCEPV